MRTTTTTGMNVKRAVKTAAKNAESFDKTWGGLISGRQTAFMRSILNNEDFQEFSFRDQKSILKAVLKAQSH